MRLTMLGVTAVVASFGVNNVVVNSTRANATNTPVPGPTNWCAAGVPRLGERTGLALVLSVARMHRWVAQSRVARACTVALE